MSSSMMTNEEEEDERRILRYLKSFPPMWRFDSTEEELIAGFLKKNLQNAPLPINLIKDVHLYHHNPWELTEKFTSYKGNEFYFFTLRDRKYAIRSFKNRVAGIGYWMANDKETLVYDSNGVLIVSKRLLDFYKGKAPNGDKTSWVMHEYKAKDLNDKGATYGITTNVGGDMKLVESVLCKIYKRVEVDPAATPPPPAAASTTRERNTTTRERNTGRDLYKGSDIYYDRDGQSNKWVGKVFERAEEEPAAAAENRLNIIENTVTRVENTATREGSSSGDIHIGTSGISYDKDTFVVWQSNTCLGKVFKRAEEEPAATPAPAPIEDREE